MRITVQTRKSHVNKTSKPIFVRAIGTEEWTWFPSSEEAARQIGGNSGGVSCVLHGKAKTYYGFEFKYDTETTGLGDGLGHGLGDRLGDGLGDGLGDRLGDRLGNELGDGLGDGG